MRLSFLFPLLLLLGSSSTLADVRPRTPQPRTYDTHRYYTLELHRSASPSLASYLAQQLGLELVEPLGELAGHWIVRLPGESTPSHLAARSLSDPDAVLKRWEEMRSIAPRGTEHHLRGLTPLVTRQRAKRVPPSPLKRRNNMGLLERADNTELLFAQNDLGLADPMLGQQWHLINTDMKDIELNVTGLWAKGITGKGVKVVIVDDGLDLNSDDLAPNFYAEGSYDFNEHTELPLPRLSDDQHGTRCAGEIAAVPNDVCGVGVSYNSQIAGVRILSAPISDADEAAALNYAYQLNDIYSCSWGPPDDGKSMEAPEGLILKAMVNGVQNGRGGKGSVFVFAAGNGGGADDQCNFDGYTNSIFSITIGAVDRKGLHPYYSELCSAMMIVAPSSGSGDHIHTTDTGKANCAHTHGGTSAAAPLAAGVFALALQVRPELTWRDFQHIAVRTGVFFNPADPDWEKTAAGRNYSYKYGYGRLDAGLFVEYAETWKLVKPQAWFDSPQLFLPPHTDSTVLPDHDGENYRRQDEPTPTEGETNPDGAAEPAESEPAPPPPPLDGTPLTKDGITSSFEVTSKMLKDSNFERLEHITAHVWIAHSRRGDVEVELTSPNGITSVLARPRRFDEENTGFWGWRFMSLKHWDENPVGTWTIKVKDQGNPQHHGRFISWSLQLWGESIDAKKAVPWSPAEEGQPDEEKTGSEASQVVSQKPKPTEHLPGDHGEASGEATEPGLASPTAGPGSDEDIAEPDTSGGVDEGFFDGIQSLASSSAWLAGAGMIIVLLGAGIGAFFYVRSRRRNQNLFGLANNGEGARGAYAPLSEDVPMGLLERGRRKLGGGGGGSRNAARTKELYDAFGDGPSDDSEDDGLDERTALRYHDDFLDDEDGHEHGQGHDERRQPPEYRDDPEEKSSGSGNGSGGSGAGAGADGRGGDASQSGTGSSSSWQDAADEAPRS